MGYSKFVLKLPGKVFVDTNTKLDSSNHIGYNYFDHCNFKGKNFKLPIY